MLAMALVVAACGAAESSETSAATETTVAAGDGDGEFRELTLAVTPVLPFIPLFVAAEQGYWTDEGLDVSLLLVEGGRAVNAAISAAEADLGAINLGTTTASARASGLLVKSIAAYYNAADHIAHAGTRSLIARADSGIDADDPQTLVGKSIGVAEGSTSDFYVRAHLAENGIDPADVEFVNIPDADHAISIEQELVDAVAPVDPFTGQIIRQLGDNAVTVSRGAAGYVADVLGVAGLEGFIDRESNTEALNGFVAGVAKASQYVRQNPEESAAILQSYLDGLNVDDAVDGLQYMRWDPRISLCTEVGILTTANGLIERGVIEVEEPFAIENLVDTRFLDHVIAEQPELFEDLPELPDDESECLGPLD